MRGRSGRGTREDSKPSGNKEREDACKGGEEREDPTRKTAHSSSPTPVSHTHTHAYLLK